MFRVRLYANKSNAIITTVIQSKQLLQQLRTVLGVMNEQIVDAALNSSFSDFEDGLQYFSVQKVGISTILTRNVQDYRVNDIVVQTAEDYLRIHGIEI